MPDWTTHVLVAWSLATILGFRFKQFSQNNVAIVMMGALIPDIYKITLVLDSFGINVQSFLSPIHFPVGSLLIAAIISLFFIEKRLIFLLLAMGISTHYVLDLLLFSGGMEIFYPFSTLKFQIGIISVTEFNITILSIILASIVFLFYIKFNKNNSNLDVNYK
jgi:LexA-binding, inner membrane-associated putative hydrolase